MRVIVVLVALMLGACSSGHDLTSCRGSLTQANPGHWTPTAADLSLKAVAAK